ncbi:MAG: HD domain-containing protein [Rhodocyclaceae bacterium]|nr:HD domain-containing protein [Rhodocyclaceae bacterium]
MLDIHRILVQRLTLSWLAISLLIGGGLYWRGIERIDDRLVELASAEAARLAAAHIPLLKAPEANRQRLSEVAQDFLREHFIVVELYDRGHNLIAEAVHPDFEAIEERIKRQGHSFPQEETPYYERFSLEQQTVLLVVVPLRDERREIVGYFEGVFLIEPEVLQRLQDELVVSLLTTLATVLLTTLVIYPVVRGLHRDVVKFSRELLKGNIELMEVLGSAIAKRDSDTSVHNYRVAIYAVRLAEAAGLAAAPIRDLIAGAFLHDVGKIGIPDAILLKPARLDEDEFAIMRRHVALGVDILKKSAWLERARDVVEFHHEKFDGSGYLKGLKGEAIPLAARIFAIVDVFDALTSQRPYKAPMPLKEAMAIIEGSAGTHFDPVLVERFAAIVEPLYAEVSRASDAEVEALLRALIERYFFADGPTA